MCVCERWGVSEGEGESEGKGEESEEKVRVTEQRIAVRARF